jgi:hypothetical protein
MDTVLEEAGELREEGNALFTRGDYTAACAKYEVTAPGALRPALLSQLPWPPGSSLCVRAVWWVRVCGCSHAQDAVDAIDSGMLATAQADGAKAKCLLNLAAAHMKLEAWQQVQNTTCCLHCGDAARPWLRPRSASVPAPSSPSDCAGAARVCLSCVPASYRWHCCAHLPWSMAARPGCGGVRQGAQAGGALSQGLAQVLGRLLLCVVKMRGGSGRVGCLLRRGMCCDWCCSGWARAGAREQTWRSGTNRRPRPMWQQCWK